MNEIVDAVRKESGGGSDDDDTWTCGTADDNEKEAIKRFEDDGGAALGDALVARLRETLDEEKDAHAAKFDDFLETLPKFDYSDEDRKRDDVMIERITMQQDAKERAKANHWNPVVWWLPGATTKASHCLREDPCLFCESMLLLLDKDIPESKWCITKMGGFMYVACLAAPDTHEMDPEDAPPPLCPPLSAAQMKKMGEDMDAAYPELKDIDMTGKSVCGDGIGDGTSIDEMNRKAREEAIKNFEEWANPDDVLDMLHHPDVVAAAHKRKSDDISDEGDEEEEEEEVNIEEQQILMDMICMEKSQPLEEEDYTKEIEEIDVACEDEDNVCIVCEARRPNTTVHPCLCCVVCKECSIVSKDKPWKGTCMGCQRDITSIEYDDHVDYM